MRFQSEAVSKFTAWQILIDLEPILEKCAAALGIPSSTANMIFNQDCKIKLQTD